MQNMKSIIHNRDLKVFNSTGEIKESCNYRNRNNCTLDEKYLTLNICQAAIQTSPTTKKINIKTLESDFKYRLKKPRKSFQDGTI